MVLGVVLFVTPFVFGAMANTTAAWTAYIGGVLLVLVGLFDLANPDSQTGGPKACSGCWCSSARGCSGSRA